MSDYILNAQLRNERGTNASRRLRQADKVPAILYGGDQPPLALTLDHNALIKMQESESFYSSILTVNIDGQPVEALVKDLQRHPYKPKLLHVDLQRVDERHKIHTRVPVHFINESKAPGVKAGGKLIRHLTEVDITCLPANLPEYVELNVASAEVGDTLHLSDLALPQGVILTDLLKGEDHNHPILTVQAKPGAAEEETKEESES